MSTLLANRFSVSNVPIAQDPLREIPYAHAAAGVIEARSHFEQLSQLEWRIDAIDQQIEQGQEEACAHCGGSGNCYCKRKGYSSAECVRCNGSGKCHACPELARRWERRVVELRQKQAECKQRIIEVAAAVEARLRTAAPGIESCSRYHGRLVADIVFHPVVAAVHLAFSDHRPLILSPDIIWLMIIQGFANHINANAEKLRPRFVEHSGEVKIIVRRDDFIKGSPENPWPEVFDEFAERIREHIGESTHDMLLPTFTTTGLAERAAAQVVLLDAMQSYFKYELHTLCGIPQVTLEGTVDDWEMLAKRTSDLGRYDMEWWTKPLAPILDEFIAAARRRVNERFWQSIYKLDKVSGGPYTTGWITAFFPYLKSRKTDQSMKRNRWFVCGGEDLNELLYPPMERVGTRFGSGPTTEDFPSGLARAPFLWNYLSRPYEMEFLGGFVGVRQDAESLALRPEIGWVVRGGSEHELS